MGVSVSLSKINAALASIASIIEADLGKTDTLPALEMPTPSRPKKKKEQFPELVADADIQTAMNATIGVNRSLDQFMKSVNRLSEIFRRKRQADLSKVQEIKADISSKLADLTKHVQDLGQALDFDSK